MDQILSWNDFIKAFGKVNDIQVRLWHIHSMADLLIMKYQDEIQANEKRNPDEYSTPIISIAEILIEKTTACLKDIDEIDEVSTKIQLQNQNFNREMI
jgi:hypothetical protein